MCCTRLEVGNQIAHSISEVLVVSGAGGMLVPSEHQVTIENWDLLLGDPIREHRARQHRCRNLFSRRKRPLMKSQLSKLENVGEG